jgi:hypothetical protein
VSHTWRSGDVVFIHNNDTHPGSPVEIRRLRGEDVVGELEISFGDLLDFVAESLRRDAQARMDDMSPEEWVRERTGARRR